MEYANQMQELTERSVSDRAYGSMHLGCIRSKSIGFYILDAETLAARQNETR